MRISSFLLVNHKVTILYLAFLIFLLFDGFGGMERQAERCPLSQSSFIGSSARYTRVRIRKVRRCEIN